MAKTITFKVHIEGVRKTLQKFDNLPKDASKRLKAKSKKLAQKFALKARAAARAESRQAGLLAPTIRAATDRVPVVQAGGNRKVGSRSKPAYKVLFGSEFGSNEYTQFKPHRGAAGYWFFPLVESEAPAISKEWNDAADEAVREFVRGD